MLRCEKAPLIFGIAYLKIFIADFGAISVPGPLSALADWNGRIAAVAKVTVRRMRS